PTANDIGSVSPLTVYPLPEIAAWLIEAAAVPLFESLTVCVPTLPTFTFPKFSAEGLALSDACTPAPVAAIIAGEFVASLTTETVPLTEPTVVGAKTMDNTVVCPALSSIGAVIPFALKPAPTTLTCEIVTLPVPEFVTVTLFVLLFPKLIFPNATLVGLTLSVYVGGAVIASVTVTDSGEFVTPASEI